MKMPAKKKKTSGNEPERLKIKGNWEDAAAQLLRTPAGSTPPRKVKKRGK